MSAEVILYRTDDGKALVQLRAMGGSVWLSQSEIGELFATTKQNVSLHIRNILKEGELSADSVVKESLTTAADGKNYRTQLYRLEMILAVGYRVKGLRGTQFRQWATGHLAEYLVKGFVMDDERLKNPGGWDYFDELLARIREIRASEKRFYQKVRDLFALSADYQADDRNAQLFFAEVQNKLLFAVAQKTAAEIVVSRADPASPNMALRAAYASLKPRFPSARSWVAAVELSVWCHSGTHPICTRAAGIPRRSASIDSVWQTVAHSQFEYGSTMWHSMWGKGWPWTVTPSSVAHVKSVCIASPGRCAWGKNTSLSGPLCARHTFTRRWKVRS